MVCRYQSYTSWKNNSGEDQPLQEKHINEVEEPEQQTDDIILIDPINREYEDLPDDTTDKAV